MIINTDEIKNIYVAKQFCDMRKQIDGLALIVTSQFNMNVLDHRLFIFTNASRNRIKMLYYEANGFWLFTRRLENGKFKFKRHEESGVLMITPQQFNWLIEGLEFGGFNSDLNLNPAQNDMLNQMNHMNDINHMNDMNNFNNF
ncbi:IS66 family insertion sequence element accessory protein TnpB [Faecalibacillus intestinalis]|uniref:IS66 family insertion sequence element accessory protein TnpB n=1 Tax=Faecalibacillus intestinalis TaxID=1982626 RepID=UPI0022E3C5D0|nr:IS66 family insertion sequence element accessory protein TnpB [Faecalibacillus intestinalis]